MNNKKNYITKHSIARSIVSLLIMTMAAFAIVACTEKDFLGGHQSTGELQTATFEIAILPSEVAQRTRAALGEAEIDTKVSHVWIGIFYETGELLRAEEFLTDDGKWEKPTASGAHDALIWDGKVDMSVMYPDSKDKPLSKVFVAGIANYKGVDAYDGATDTKTKMEDLLAKVENWEDYQKISVDVLSAEEMAATNGRIMSNLVSFDDGHYNFTIDAPTQEFSKKFSNPDKCLFQLQDRSRDRIAGSLHLRRMIAHNVVNITPGENIELKDVRYKVFNVPLRTYVQERTTETDFFTKSDDEITAANWFMASPNAADYFDETAENKAPYYNIEFENGEATSSSDGYSFDFSHYDNKHWGLKDSKSCETYKDREKKHGSTEIYSSICPSAEKWYNNYATYFQIYATVTDKNTGVTAEAVYTIHEGYANDADLSSLTDVDENATAPTDKTKYGKRCRDFMCVRNTEYTYKVKITGLNSFTVGVEAENPAVSGFAKTVTFETGSEGSEEEVTAELYLTDAQRANLVYRIYQPASPSSTRSAAIDFGTFDRDQLFEKMASLSSEWKDDSGYGKNDNTNDDFYQGIRFYQSNGTLIGTFDEFTQASDLTDNNDELKKYIVKVEAEYDAACSYNLRDDYARFFYCYPKDAVYEKEARKYQPLIIIKQYPQLPKLAKPEVEILDFGNSISTADVPVAIANYVNSVKFKLTTASVGKDESTGNDDQATTYYVSIDDGEKVEVASAETLTAAVTTGLSAGKHTLRVSGNHELYESSDETEVEFYVYPTKMTWDFDGVSEDVVGASVSGNTIFPADSYYGMAVSSGFTIGSNYLQTGGTSSPETRSLTFTALYDGVVTIKVSGNGNGQEGRMIAVRNNKDDAKVQQEVGGVQSPVERTFNVKKGEVNIYQIGGSLRFYSVTIEYKNTWDFSTKAWEPVRKDLVAAGDDAVSNWDRDVDGLHLKGNFKAVKNNNAYSESYAGIQLNAKRVVENSDGTETLLDENYFWLEVEASGTLTLWASNTGSNNDHRKVAVQVGENSVAQEKGDLNTATTKEELSFDIRIDENATKPTKIFIYSPVVGGLRFHDKIEYKPTY